MFLTVCVLKWLQTATGLISWDFLAITMIGATTTSCAVVQTATNTGYTDPFIVGRNTNIWFKVGQTSLT